MYNIYETIPPLDTTWFTIWAKVIVILATYRRVVTAVMLNDWKGREDSAAVSVVCEKTLPYWAEPTEEAESRDSSPLSLGARSVTVMARWALCLGGGASRGSTGAHGV